MYGCEMRRKPTLLAATNTDFSCRVEDSIDHVGDASKEETTPLRRCRPIRRTYLEFPPVLEEGKNGRVMSQHLSTNEG